MEIKSVHLSALNSFERKALTSRYRKLYSLIYGKNIADRLLDLFDSNNKFLSSFSKNYQKAEEALQDYSINVDMLLLYDDNNNLSMAGRVIQTDNFIKLAEVVLFKKDPQINASLYQYLLSYLEDISKDKNLNIEILANNSILEYVSYDKNYNILDYLSRGRKFITTTYVLGKRNKNESNNMHK